MGQEIYFELCDANDVALFRFAGAREAGSQFALLGEGVYVRRSDDCPLTDSEQASFDAGRGL